MGADPVAATENLAVVPAGTDWLAGCEVIVGGTAAASASSPLRVFVATWPQPTSTSANSEKVPARPVRKCRIRSSLILINVARPLARWQLVGKPRQDLANRVGCRRPPLGESTRRGRPQPAQGCASDTCNNVQDRGGARGRSRTDTLLRAADFLTTSAFAAPCERVARVRGPEHAFTIAC